MKDKTRTIEERISHLKKAKKRITPQLLEVVRIVDSGIGHFSATDVYNEAKKKFPSISLNTIYSILKKLHSMGELQKTMTLKKKASYCPSSDVHHHITCNKCKNIEDVKDGFLNIDMESMRKALKTNYKLTSYSILFTGYCESCQNI